MSPSPCRHRDNCSAQHRGHGTAVYVEVPVEPTLFDKVFSWPLVTGLNLSPFSRAPATAKRAQWDLLQQKQRPNTRLQGMVGFPRPCPMTTDGLFLSQRDQGLCNNYTFQDSLSRPNPRCSMCSLKYERSILLCTTNWTRARKPAALYSHQTAQLRSSSLRSEIDQDLPPSGAKHTEMDGMDHPRLPGKEENPFLVGRSTLGNAAR